MIYSGSGVTIMLAAQWTVGGSAEIKYYHMRRKEIPINECMAPSPDIPTCPVVKIIPY